MTPFKPISRPNGWLQLMKCSARLTSADKDIGAQPDHRTGGDGKDHRTPQHNQRSVNDRGINGLQYTRRPIRREFQAEGGCFSTKNRPAKGPTKQQMRAERQLRRRPRRPRQRPGRRNRAGASPPMKIVATSIWVGHRPLQREKLLVMMAMSRSLGLSITRVDTIAAALHPNPMLIVSACFPCAPASFEPLVQIERYPGQIAEVFQKRKQRKENRHRRQHDADHPRHRQVNAVHQQGR